MLYLVTGGGGFLGRHIVARLRERGDAVRVFGRGHYPDLAASGVELRQGRLQDADALNDACVGVDGVFHVASKTGIAGRYKEYYQANVAGTHALLAACLRRGVARLVYTSTPSVVFGEAAIVNGDEHLPCPARFLSHYADTKAQAERSVLAANGATLRTCALRPHLIWGPGDTNLLPRMVARARAGRLLQVGEGENLVSVSYVENTAFAHLAAMDALAKAGQRVNGSGQAAQNTPEEVGGRAFFINEPEPVNCWGFINRLLSLCGVAPVRKKVSFRAAYAAGFIFEQLGRLRSSWEPPMTRFLALQLAKDHYFSPQAACRGFCWQPIFSLDEGLARLRCSLQR